MCGCGGLIHTIKCCVFRHHHCTTVQINTGQICSSMLGAKLWNGGGWPSGWPSGWIASSLISVSLMTGRPLVGSLVGPLVGPLVGSLPLRSSCNSSIARTDHFILHFRSNQIGFYYITPCTCAHGCTCCLSAGQCRRNGFNQQWSILIRPISGPGGVHYWLLVVNTMSIYIFIY